MPLNSSSAKESSVPETTASSVSRPDIEAKWGRPPPSKSRTESSGEAPDFATYYTPEEQEALRAKGINPTLKAEMEWSKQKSQGKGFWGKFAGTAMGGGGIK